MRINKYTTRLNKDKVCELVKEKGTNYSIEEYLTSPKKIVQMMNTLYDMKNLSEEYVFLLCLNTKNKPVGIFEISHGTVNSSLISPREIFINALLCNAVNIVLIHNHPSGDSTPSVEDIAVTRRIKEGGNIIGVSLIDHIIIGDKTYHSLADTETL